MSAGNDKPGDVQLPIVVAGFGAAGGVAAIAAAESGVPVIVIERAPGPDHGGSTRASTFYMRMNSVDELKADCAPLVRQHTLPWVTEEEIHGTSGVWGADRDFVEAWLAETVPTVQWLRGMGIGFSFRESDMGDPPGVMPDGGGAGLLEGLEARARELGVTIEYGSALVDLEMGVNGAVSAVVVESDSGRRSMPCRSVILATGGFHGNVEMMTRYLGPRARFAMPLSKWDFYVQGEGVKLGLELGAATAGDFGDWHSTLVDARADGVFSGIGGYEFGILVNDSGERFVDESGGEAARHAVREEKGGVAYVIIDDGVRQNPLYGPLFNSPSSPIVADSVEDLAAKIGVPADVLARTVADYNAACRAGGSGSAALPIPKTADARELSAAPFEAWPVRAGMVLSLGGLKVDRHGRVLSADSRPIAGLYAAGDTAGGFFDRYVGYTGSMKAIVLGMLSGRHAAGAAVD